MAQLNITLNYEEMRDLLSKDTSGAFKKLMQDSLNAILVAESDEQISFSYMKGFKCILCKVFIFI